MFFTPFDRYMKLGAELKMFFRADLSKIDKLRQDTFLINKDVFFL